MWVGIGVGIGRNRFATGIFGAYESRVIADGGVVEAGQCVDAVTGLLLNASLLLIPSGYKGGKLYAEIPTNGNGDLTWTRGSDAFRTNASGVLQRVPWNLLLNTNTFSGWSLEGGALTSGFTAPDGTSTAYKYVQTTGGLYSGSSTATSGSKTASIWLKSVSGTSITCNLQDGGSGNNTVVTVTGDWQLFTATYTTSTSRPSLYVWGISNASGIYVWHPQLVEGTTAQTYLPTTDRLNFPRLSYMYGSCPSALLEPQRTNLLANQLSYNASTGVAYNTSVTDSPIIGINSARITKNEASGSVRYANQSCSNSALTGSTTYTISAYFKYDGYDFQTSMEYNNSTNFGGTSWTQPINIASTGITLGTSSQCTGNIQNVGNGWYRVSVTITTGASPVGSTVTYLMRLPSTLSTGQGFLQAVPQFEQGAYSTTVIPTSGATATRVADSFSRNNIYTNGLITSSGGTWFVELRNNIGYARDVSSSGLYIDTSNSALTNGFAIRNPSSAAGNQLMITKVVSGVLTPLYSPTTSTAKIAIKWNGTNADIFVNGTKEVSATSFTPTAMEFLNALGSDVPKFIQSMALYPTPLTDTQCQTLTTL